jgi:NADH-quinone oxidoreductase subunit H
LLALTTIILLLLTIALFTLAERKIMGAIQRRYGPNVTGLWGLLQPFADGIKLIFKEVFLPGAASRLLYLGAPSITFIATLINWAFIPFNDGNFVVDFNYSLLYVYAIMSFSVYGLILAGWVSNARYAFIGAVRAVAQMISYEVSLSFIFFIMFVYSQSTNIIDIVNIQNQLYWFIFVLSPLFVITIICMFAETNRIPFDLPEAEAELVAGYNLEYSGIPFALFFLAEYGAMLFSAFLLVLLFMGGWHSELCTMFSSEFILIIKVCLVWFTFIAVRAAYPRYRFDQLIKIGWTVLFPLTFSLTILYIVVPLVMLYN